MSASPRAPALAGLGRRLALAYASAFAVVLVACVLVAHVTLALTLQGDERARLGELARQARDAYEIKHGRPKIDSDGPQLADATTEGVVWLDRAGAPLAIEGRDPRAASARPGDELARAAATPWGSIRVATGTARDAALLRRADLALGLGTVVALALASAGGLLLARRSIARARETIVAMRDFTADAAHELRGPLAAVLGNAQASLRASADLPPAHARRFETVAATARSMSRTVDDLLLLARAESVLGHELHAVDLAATAAAVVAARGDLAASLGVELRTAASGRVRVYGDPAELERAIANLVENALRFTPAGGRVDVACAAARGVATVEVRDTGTGIAAADVPRIFDRFWHGDPVRGAQAGSGLGLAIVRALARRHGGDVTVASAPGAGSTFALSLPERPPRPAL